MTLLPLQKFQILCRQKLTVGRGRGEDKVKNVCGSAEVSDLTFYFHFDSLTYIEKQSCLNYAHF